MNSKKVLRVTLLTLSAIAVIGSTIYAAGNITSTQNPKKTSTVNYISEGKAKQIALENAKVSEKDAIFVKVKLDKNDQIPEYEIEFYNGTTEYDYDIDAVTGKILSVDYDAEYYNPTKKDFPTKSPKGQAYITPAKAKTTALNHAKLTEKNITNYKINLDYDDGIAQYEINFYSGTKEYEYDINAITGVVISFEQEENDNLKPGNPQNSNGVKSEDITAAKAKEIALKSAGVSESSIRKIKVEFDYDDGLAQYEVEFEVGNYEYSYEIDAKTGAILSSEIDD